jgi:hypothetical protein
LCCLPRLCVKRCGVRETREQEEGEGARSSGEYSQFVSVGKAHTVDATSAFLAALSATATAALCRRRRI